MNVETNWRSKYHSSIRVRQLRKTVLLFYFSEISRKIKNIGLIVLATLYKSKNLTVRTPFVFKVDRRLKTPVKPGYPWRMITDREFRST